MILNAILIAVHADLVESAVPNLVEALDIIDTVTLLIFFGEILLKWADSFTLYWTDPWNVFDFTVTIAVRVRKATLQGLISSRRQFRRALRL